MYKLNYYFTAENSWIILSEVSENIWVLYTENCMKNENYRSLKLIKYVSLNESTLKNLKEIFINCLKNKFKILSSYLIELNF